MNLAAVSLGGVVAHVRSSWTARELRDDILPAAKATVVVVDALETNFREALEALDEQPEAHRPPIRAVVVLGALDAVHRAVAELRASINVIGAQDLLAVNSLATDEAAMTPSLESLAARVTPDHGCLLAFDYDPMGRVRGAELSHDNVLFTAAALVRSFGLIYRDRLVGYMPLQHVASQVLEFYVPIIAGLSVVCAPTYNRPLVRVVTEHKPTVFFATPATWARFSQQVYRAKGDVNAAVYRWAKTRATNNSQKLLFARGKGAKRRSLGYMLAKALVLNNIKKKVGLESCTACYSVLAPLDFELERLFKTVDTPIYQLFGTAETSGFAAINFSHAWEFGSSGRALPGTTIRCDERSQETVLRGRNVFMGYRYAPHGYCNSPDPERDDGSSDQYTSTCDSDGWLQLWQRGFLTPTGFLKISDPRDFLVLSTGDWVPIQPFEFAMLELMPELDRVVLIGDGRTFLSALFFLKTSNSTSRAAAGAKHTNGHVLDEDALRVGHAIGSSAMTVGEAIRCQQWAVHFDSVLEDLPKVCSVSGFRVRKWILMAADFTVESGELDPDTGDVCRRAVDRNLDEIARCSEARGSQVHRVAVRSTTGATRIERAKSSAMAGMSSSLKPPAAAPLEEQVTGISGSHGVRLSPPRDFELTRLLSLAKTTSRAHSSAIMHAASRPPSPCKARSKSATSLWTARLVATLWKLAVKRARRLRRRAHSSAAADHADIMFGSAVDAPLSPAASEDALDLDDDVAIMREAALSVVASGVVSLADFEAATGFRLPKNRHEAAPLKDDDASSVAATDTSDSCSIADSDVPECLYDEQPSPKTTIFREQTTPKAVQQAAPRRETIASSAKPATWICVGYGRYVKVQQ
ncbi:unnamed protein product [Phytophthora fragariaefolia]|uniref:Unnamed protein product n=1 Tax=Phytophthora fragariaefolia TaxID=1490495 RepID=A0A9W6WZ35_9STRA|nr:unnamed protein product [Phytophthora fragariaefolia]